HPGIGEGAGRVDRADAAAGLDGDGDGVAHPGDELAVVGLAGAGGVEVDHVDPRHAGGLEPQRDLDGVVGMDGLAVEVALDELDDLAAAQVDGGVQVHHALPCWTRSTKFCMKARPGVEDFSGWNCAACTWPCSTAATTGPP